MFISVLLPLPDAPMIATYSPRVTARLIVAQRHHRDLARVVTLLDVLEREQGRGSPISLRPGVAPPVPPAAEPAAESAGTAEAARPSRYRAAIDTPLTVPDESDDGVTDA